MASPRPPAMSAGGDAHDALPFIHDTGITTIHDPSSTGKDAIADIVFVHGLKGHPRKTWLHENKSSKAQQLSPSDESARSSSPFRRVFNRSKRSRDKAASPSPQAEQQAGHCFWPYHLLSKDPSMTGTRIMVYGYNSEPTNFYKSATTQMTITQHARNLMNVVADERVTCEGRPLIFVAHSLGGILVKDALNESVHAIHRKEHLDIARSCRTIVFMGTPHLGASLAAWGTMVANVVGALPGGFSTYDKVLRGLEPESEVLDRIGRQFGDMLNSEAIRICSVQEGRGMTSVKGVDQKVVPDYSSSFNRRDKEDLYVNQTANHMDVCKFSSMHDPTYKAVSRFLQRRCQEIKETQTEQERRDQAAICDQLDYSERLGRERQLDNDVDSPSISLDWIWKSVFAEWLASESDDKIFWIAGKPASGKSTLVNYVAKHEETQRLIESSLGDEAAVAYFFFDFRAGKGIANSFEGLRKSLLHQLLSHFSIGESAIRSRLGLNSYRELTNTDLAKIFQHVLGEGDQAALLLLDGLDEYAGHKPELVGLIKDITRYRVKICVSSRNEVPFSSAYRDITWKLYMDRVNGAGIETYAHRKLTDAWDPKGAEEKEVLDDAAKTISYNSSGVFLWARFAVSDILDMLIVHQTLAQGWIRSVIDNMPADLEARYAHTFDNIAPQNRRPCGIIFQLVNAARRSLLVSELFEAALLAGISFNSLNGPIQSKEVDAFERYVGIVTCGLIEPVLQLPDDPEEPHEEALHLRTIHRTVQTYLHKAGWKQLLGEMPLPGFQQILWIQVCKLFFAGKGARWPDADDNEDSLRSQAFGSVNTKIEVVEELGHGPVGDFQRSSSKCHSIRNYAYDQVLGHASQYEQEAERSCRPLIHGIMTPTWLKQHLDNHKGRHTVWTPRGVDKFALFGSDVHIAVLYGLIYYLKEALHQFPTMISSNTEPFISAMRAHRTRKSIGQRKPLSDVKRPSLLATAVWCLSHYETRLGAEIIRFLAPISPRLHDLDMLMAIVELPTSEIEVLLARYPLGPLTLRSTLYFYDIDMLEQAEYPDFTCGPLWAVGQRMNDVHENRAVLRLFLDRGEDIDGQCGPFGTVLHSVVAVIDQYDYWSDAAELSVRSFIEFGANVHTRVTQGNVLEFAWKQAHTETITGQFGSPACGALIKLFIDMDVANAVCDPNGEVPSKERTLALSGKDVPSPEDMSLYYYGTIARSSEWSIDEYGYTVRVRTGNGDQSEGSSDEDASDEDTSNDESFATATDIADLRENIP